ncbi:MAG: hypothetical protein PHV98_00655 [Candidatus Omnitrophica bacterium]|nr:hypothetical protein [Candidatus Omnitrophota bacterium]
MWIQLKSSKRILENGKEVTRNPGDWVNIGKQLALLWISQGDAIIPGKSTYKEFDLSPGSGILVTGDENIGQKTLEPIKTEIEIVYGAINLPFQYTVIWKTELPLMVEKIAVGLMLLQTWEMAVPLFDYDTLAANVGSEEERNKTKAIIRDLRVPLYDTRLMFIKTTRETQYLIDTWVKEVQEGTDEKLSFLRCLYRVKPLILALPISWTNHNVR